MDIITSTIEQDGYCDYCQQHQEFGLKGSIYPYEKVFVVIGNKTKNVFCASCFSQLQSFGGAKKLRLVLGFHGGKETALEISGEPTKEEIVRLMEIHNADNYRIEYIL